jgi:carbon-monoxide dehydrogenase medium subunit
MLPTNTHILFHEFDYAEPNTVEDVVSLLGTWGDAARVMAGGTDLLVQMKMERRQPAHVISLRRVSALRGIHANGGLGIGAATSIRALYRSPEITSRYPALAEACNWFSTVQIMNMATLGGNLCNASPAADSAPVLLVHDATVTLQSRDGARMLPLEQFFLAPGRTALQPDELLTEIHLPYAEPNTTGAFIKLSRVVADISQVCAAVQLTRDGNTITAARIALGSVAPTPIRALRAEAALTGEAFSPELAAHVGALAAEESRPISDARASREYRQQAVRVLVRDALEKAWRQPDPP